AIIGGSPERFVTFVGLYREAWEEAGCQPAAATVSVNSHGALAAPSADAAEGAVAPDPHQAGTGGRERGWPRAPRREGHGSGGPPPPCRHFHAERSPHGALFIADPQEVIDKILWEHELFGHQRCLVQFSVGTMPHMEMLRAIELFGTVVAPAVRKALGVMVP